MKKAKNLLRTILIKRRTLIATTTTFWETQTQHQQLLKNKNMDNTDSSQQQRYTFNPSLHWNLEVQDYFIKAYGHDRFNTISKSLTYPSRYSCIRVNSLKSSRDTVTQKLLGVLQQQGLPTRVSITKCQIPGVDNVLFVEGSGPHNVDYCCDGMGKPIKEIVVSRKCAEAVLRGAQVFVPGVLACSAHVEEGDTVAVSVAIEQPSSDGGWAVGITRGIVLQGSPSDPHYFERNGLYIGLGTTMMSRAGIFRASHGIAVEMTNRLFELPSFHSLLEGEIFLQNLPSIITAHALDPQPGERILDMCAAPGGKTTAIAILMKDTGEVFASDRSHNKVLDIRNLVKEMGLNCITAYRLDALKSVCQGNASVDFTTQCCKEEVLGGAVQNPGSFTFELDDKASVTKEACQPDVMCKENDGHQLENNGSYLSKAEVRKNARRMRNGPGRSHSVGGRVENLKGFPPCSFDRVLLDAPCSALGLRPRLFAGEETIESLRKHGKYQRKMFDQAVQLVRPGGVLVYSTCTINPGENEALVRYALDKYKFLSLAPQNPRIGGPGLVGCFKSCDGKHVEEWLRPGEENLVQRFDPSSSLDTIGFFIAKFNVGQKDA